MIILLSEENKAGIILSHKEKRKYDITYNPASFKIGKKRVSSKVLLVLFKINFFFIFFFLFLWFFSKKKDSFKIEEQKILLGPFSSKKDDFFEIKEQNILLRPIFLKMSFRAFFGFVSSWVLFIISTRDTELDRSIMDNLSESLKWGAIGIPSCFLLLFLVFLLGRLAIVLFILAIVGVLIKVFYHNFYILILLIRKFFLYFFATEEEKNKWKEEFIKENRAQPVENKD